MGKRARRRGDAGKGTRQRYKQRALGIEQAGLSKPMLDAMNEVSKAEYGVGIGVVVQEEERARSNVASLQEERRRVPWWQLRKRKQVGTALKVQRDELAIWGGRLKTIAARVSNDAPVHELKNFAAQRAAN